MTLKETQESIGRMMEAIVAHFAPGVKITVMVRSPGYPDRDFMMTDDDPAEVAAMLQRRSDAVAQATVVPELAGSSAQPVTLADAHAVTRAQHEEIRRLMGAATVQGQLLTEAKGALDDLLTRPTDGAARMRSREILARLKGRDQ